MRGVLRGCAETRGGRGWAAAAMALWPVAQADRVGRQRPGAPRVLGAPPHAPTWALEKRSSVSRAISGRSLGKR
eukprot:COSAG06_NODE_9483_length_1889_cov_1.819553_2_plen_73_part_01